MAGKLTPNKKSTIIQPFMVMDVLERAKKLEQKGVNIVHLEIGEPDFPTPNCIVKETHKAIRQGITRYTHSQGTSDIRVAICDYYKKKYGVKIDPERVIVTTGSSPGLLLILISLLRNNDEVILQDPSYACYPNFISFLGGKPIYIKSYEEEGYKFSIKRIKKKITKKTRLILINSPANPTGNVLSEQNIKEIVHLGLPIISDEIYHSFNYVGDDHTILEFTKEAFVLNGFSKRYAMTGWRLGYIVVPENFIRPIQKLQQNFFICPNAFVQIGGIAAIYKADKDVQIMKQEYSRRRNFILNELKKKGFELKYKPNGAYYVLMNMRKYTKDSYKFALEILEKAKVAVAPGVDFGPSAEGFMRLSYANSIDNIREGIKRLKNFLSK